jgi:glycine/D-amino acid oxidase-like deaminating enzyme
MRMRWRRKESRRNRPFRAQPAGPKVRIYLAPPTSPSLWGFSARLAQIAHGLASRAGAILHPYTAVTAIERVASGFSVRTIRGEIRARDVLIATNGYTGDAFPEFQRRVIPMGSYIVVTERRDPAVAQRIIPKAG